MPPKLTRRLSAGNQLHNLHARNSYKYHAEILRKWSISAFTTVPAGNTPVLAGKIRKASAPHADISRELRCIPVEYAIYLSPFHCVNRKLNHPR